jgi:DNA-3-methyladenine glycosylase
MSEKGCIFHFENYKEKTGIKLGEDFYQSEDILTLSRELLGKVIVTCFDGVKTSAVIVESEAYKAPEDKASHAYKDLKTERTDIMFKSGGTAYVYLCYGIHHMFNVVSGPEGQAHAILIRAVEPLDGIDAMIQRRGLKKWRYNLTSGPGTLTKALGIKTSYTGISLVTSPYIQLEDRGIIIESDNLVACPRIGIDYAEEWADKPWRFVIKNNPWVSHRRAEW